MKCSKVHCANEYCFEDEVLNELTKLRLEGPDSQWLEAEMSKCLHPDVTVQLVLSSLVTGVLNSFKVFKKQAFRNHYNGEVKHSYKHGYLLTMQSKQLLIRI